MKSRHTQAFSWTAAVCLALSGLLAAGCERNGESDAVQVTRDAEGDTQIKVDGDQVDKNLEQAGEELKAGAEQVKEAANDAGAALERGAERVNAEVGPVVQDVLDDAGVTARVKARLVADPDVNAFHIDVDTVDGRVTLNGKVASEHERQEAEELANRTEGVVSVVNLIQVAGKEALPPPPGR
ncbi:MAG TPA: BON domain-containing protein [Thermoanaerobaculia bacterium]|nr:BON domain-containing protein [Thermoanaerobaculia bacterium]